MATATADPPVKAVPDPAPDPEDTGAEHTAPRADDELALPGSKQLSFDVGGKPPTTATLRLNGGKIEVEGAFRKGERIAIRVEAVVDDIGFKDSTDPATGQVIGCERRQKARIVGVSIL